MAQVRCLNAANGDAWQAIHGDAVDVLAQLPNNSADFSVYSPPFGSLTLPSAYCVTSGQPREI